MKNTMLNAKQNGFTLVELLIGLFISLLVGGVAITYLTTASRVLANQNSEDVIQENVRFAFEIMSSNIRLAGSNVSLNAQTFEEEKRPVYTGVICPGTANCNTDNVTLNLAGGQSAGTSESDSAAFSYIADRGTTCTGVAITREQQIVTHFFVADLDNDNVFSLYCNSYVAFQNFITQDFTGHSAPNPAVALIDGIESLQFQYGLDLDAPKDDTVDSYVAYPNIAVANLDDIRSVKIGLLFSNAQDNNSLANTEDTAANVTYQIMDGSATINGRVMRQVATTTVFLPNS